MLNWLLYRCVVSRYIECHINACTYLEAKCSLYFLFIVPFIHVVYSSSFPYDSVEVVTKPVQ
jgi:hypothetical protein